MDRRRKMLKKRRRKQRQAEAENPQVRLIFAEGYAAVKGAWKPGSDEPKPASPDEQP